MATSGVYTITITGRQMITDVLIEIGAIDADETPSSNEILHGLRQANLLIKNMEGPPNFINPGKKMWQREQASITPSASQNYYDLQPSGGDCDIQIPIEILHVWLNRTADDIKTPLKPMSFRERQLLSDPTAQITPTRWDYERRSSSGRLYLDGYCTSDIVSNYTINITYRQPFEIIQATKEFDIMPEYLRMLKWNLCKELSPGHVGEVSKSIDMLSKESTAQAATFEPETCDQFFEPGRDD